VFARQAIGLIVVVEARMIRQGLTALGLSQRGSAPAHKADWARRSDMPMVMVLAWVAALALTTEGLMTFQHLFG
jgi:hypothetical protein